MLAVILLMIAALAFFGPPTRAEVTIDADAGVVLLSTGPEPGDVWVRYYEDTSSFDIESPTASQTISVNKCLAELDDGSDTTDGSEELLTITQIGGSKGLGLVDNGFGTRDKNNCATGNGQIAIGEQVTIGIGSYFEDDVRISRVEVDIEGKQNADLVYSADGVPAPFVPIDAASDNGPDSGANDNDIIEIDFALSPIETISFEPFGNSKALISVEGGGDGDLPGTTPDSIRDSLGVNQTLFALTSSRSFDGVLDCNQSRTLSDGPAGDGIAESITVFRGPNDPLKAETCISEVYYTLNISSTEVFFDFYDVDNQGAEFFVTIEWTAGINPVAPPIRFVDYEDDGLFESGRACGLVTGGTYSDPPLTTDDYVHPTTDDYPDGVPACLAYHELVPTAAGWQQIQTWHVIGDPKWY